MLLVDPDRKHLNWLTRIARSLVGAVVATESFIEPSPEHRFDLIVVNYDTMTPGERQMIRRWRDRHVPVLAFTSASSFEALASICENRDTQFLLAKNDRVDAVELIVTIQKILRRDIFGLGKYFAWGVEHLTLTVRDSDERQAAMETGENYARAIGLHDRFISQYSSVIDEFVSNALYNAPVDPEGRKRYAHLSRRERVRLNPQEGVSLTFCCDGRLLGVSTTDGFGSLRSEEIINYLSKCFRKGPDQVDAKAGGAGLGFYFVLNCLSKLIVNIDPRRRTEIIGLMDVSGSYRDFASQTKSFQIFEHVP
jgi:hypothetical protein